MTRVRIRGKKEKLKYRFEQLVKAIADADLPPEGVEVIELVEYAKIRCWKVLESKPRDVEIGETCGEG